MSQKLAPHARPRLRHAPVTDGGTALLADVVRRVRAGSHALSHADQQFLSDLAAGKYRTVWLARLLDLAARAGNDHAAYAPAAVLEEAIAARRPQLALSLPDAIAAETTAQAQQDVLPMLAAVRDCPSTAHAAVEVCQRHLHTARALIRALAVRARELGP